MRVRSITTCALGLAAALQFVASPLAAQDSTRLRKPSDQRINISKGEVTTTRTDTVYVTRYDTVRVNNTIVRIDTVTVTPPAPLVIAKVKGPMYWGVFGGSSRPWGNIDRVYTNGFHAGGLVGWESQQSPFGLRLDGAVTQVGREETLTGPSGGLTSTNVGSGTPLIMHLAADAKVAPILLRGWKPYLVGGVNFNRFRGMALASKTGSTPCDFNVRGSCFQNASTSWGNKFGFNFGLGTDFHIGSQDMFIEYRYIATRANEANSYINPISIGVRYF